MASESFESAKRTIADFGEGNTVFRCVDFRLLLLPRYMLICCHPTLRPLPLCCVDCSLDSSFRGR